MSEFKLEFDAARWSVNINSSTGTVILQKKDEPLLYQFTVHEDGSYSNEWIRQCPENKHWDRSYLTDAGDIILQDSNGHTYLYDHDMQLIDSWQYRGHLITCLPGPRTVYFVEKGEREYVIDIRRRDGEVLQLEPVASTWVDEHMSVCEDETTGKLVVADYMSNAIDIFYKRVSHNTY